jgi:hypothetical protein
MSIRRIVGIGLLSAGMIAGTATAAFAGGSPTPSPVNTPQFGYQPKPVAVPWQFDLQQSDIGLLAPAVAINVNDVESGPTGILMRNWTDVQLSPTVDRFQRGPNSVTLRHDSLFGAVLTENIRTCTVTLDQDNGRFRIIAGTGTGAGFRSFNGRFDLRAMLSFPLRPRTGFCPLAFVGRYALLQFIVNNASVGLPAPTFVDVSVQGRADIVRVRPLHIFAPTASPTDTVSPSYAAPTNS